jgi:hypothetical protein
VRVAARRKRQAQRSPEAETAAAIGRAAAEAADVSPSPERRQHDQIAKFEKTVADTAGLIGRPFRVVDTTGRMLAAGTITPEQHAAGVRFADDFGRASLSAVRAVDWARPNVGRGALPDATVMLFGPRERVWRALGAVGGMASPAGSCLWAVLGEGYSLRHWATLRGLKPQAASRVLRGALAALVTFYDSGGDAGRRKRAPGLGQRAAVATSGGSGTTSAAGLPPESSAALILAAVRSATCRNGSSLRCA